MPCPARLRIRILLTEIRDASELEKKATIKMLIRRIARLTSALEPMMGRAVSPTKKTSTDDYTNLVVAALLSIRRSQSPSVTP